MNTAEKIHIEYMFSPEVDQEERNKWLRSYLSSYLAKLKRTIREFISLRERTVINKAIVQLSLELEKGKRFKNQYLMQELEEQIEDMKGTLSMINNSLASLGGDLNTALPIYETVATVHDFAQLINVNMKDIEKHLADGERLSREEDPRSLFVELVFVHGAERRETRSSCKDFFTKEDSIHMPFKEALTASFLKEMRTNKEFKQKTDEIMEEVFPGLFEPKSYNKPIKKKGSHLRVIK